MKKYRFKKVCSKSIWDDLLIVDFEALEVEEIRSKRNELTRAVSRINKIYPGTDEESFQKAQREIGNYIFKEGEADKIFESTFIK